jgi:DNA-3-methyladenine glycosylase II
LTAAGSGAGGEDASLRAPARSDLSALSSPSAVAHLRAADPVLRAVIDATGGLEGLGDWRAARGAAELDHYGALIRSIVGQQVSTGAARAMFRRLTDRYGGRTPTPEEVLAEDPDELRAAAGLSRAKTSFLRSLAEHVVDGRLELDRLDELSDDAVIAELVAVKGIGPWSAHVFLMMQLLRPDVIAVGDLGLRRAIERHYGLAGPPAPAEMEAIAEPWRPHRTLACLFLWRSLRVLPI